MKEHIETVLNPPEEKEVESEDLPELPEGWEWEKLPNGLMKAVGPDGDEVNTAQYDPEYVATKARARYAENHRPDEVQELLDKLSEGEGRIEDLVHAHEYGIISDRKYEVLREAFDRSEEEWEALERCWEKYSFIQHGPNHLLSMAIRHERGEMEGQHTQWDADMIEKHIGAALEKFGSEQDTARKTEEGADEEASTIVLVACSKSKLTMVAQAQGLYKGQLFQKSSAYAKQLVEDGEADAWYILSAKHGLLEPTETIEPYDQTLSGETTGYKKKWAQEVVDDLLYAEIDELSTPVELLVLGGKDYWQSLKQLREQTEEETVGENVIGVCTPFKGMAGNGEMMAWLDDRLEEDVYTEPSTAELRESGGDGAPTESTDPDDLLRGRFRKSFEPYGVRITRSTLDEIDAFADCQVVTAAESGKKAVSVETHEGTLRARMGDWIFEDSQGRHYPIEHEEVTRIYELVGEADLDSGDDSGPDVGQVVPGQVDALLSAEGEDMWDPAAAEMSTIASLTVAHRVAHARQESWRTGLIAEEVRRRVDSVTEDDFPGEVWESVQSEIERRTSAVNA